ncbi:MAG: hypothetical protein QOE19_989 [Actinomycetota bacterium]|jgi:hypothetical protein|nr:hypothetical protein [Actinomycetota bacterium]MDQ1671401.1 hypothetical protein [Actinomycetota bacterium]
MSLAPLPTRSTSSDDARPGGSLHFDLHGLATMEVDASAPTADQLSTMFGAFRSAAPAEHPDIVVKGAVENRSGLSVLEHELAYDDETVLMPHAGVQVIRRRGQWEVQGAGELLTTVLPILDIVAVEHGYAMIHAATMDIAGVGIAMPAAGGTGKTSTIAKAMRWADTAFMGDDWAFVSDQSELLGYAKPMFIKPHHRPIYPHLFEGVRKPLIPPALSGPVSRLTTIVHPAFARRPKLAAFSRRWSPEHRMVEPKQALQGKRISSRCPLRLAVFVERWQGSDVRLLERDKAWMAARMLGNWHIEMARHSRDVLTALGASGVLSLDEIFGRKAAILHTALDSSRIALLQVPSAMSADEASDAIVAELRRAVGQLADPGAA